MRVIQAIFGGIAEDSDPCVRKAVCQFIIDVCNECDSSYHVELLLLLQKVCLLIYYNF